MNNSMIRNVQQRRTESERLIKTSIFQAISRDGLSGALFIVLSFPEHEILAYCSFVLTLWYIESREEEFAVTNSALTIPRITNRLQMNWR